MAVLLYCRAGFEAECAAEIQERAGALGVYGYCKAQPDSGLVTYECKPEEGDHIARKIPVSSLIFARQLFARVADLNDLSVDDRVAPMVAALKDTQLCGRLWIETTDTNDGRALSALCKSITKPLTVALQTEGILATKEITNRPVLHVLFRSTHSVVLGYSYSYNHSPMNQSAIKCTTRTGFSTISQTNQRTLRFFGKKLKPSSRKCLTWPVSINPASIAPLSTALTIMP